jgi:hypothetical protein
MNTIFPCHGENNECVVCVFLFLSPPNFCTKIWYKNLVQKFGTKIWYKNLVQKTHNTHFLHPFIIFPIKMIKPLGYKGTFLTTRVSKKAKKLYKTRPVAAAAPPPDDSPPPAPDSFTPEIIDLTLDDDSDDEEPPVVVTPVLSILDPNHEDFNNVYRGPSKFRGAGLYAKRDIAKHERICWYDGQYVRTAHAESEAYSGNYLFRIDETWSIDSSDRECTFGRYVDDCIEFQKYNSEFAIARLADGDERVFLHLGCVHKTSYRIALFAIRDIKRNEPIFASYGNEYWADPVRFEKLTFEHRSIMYERSQKVRLMAKKNPYLVPLTIPDDVVSDPELQVDYLTRDF